MDSDTQSLLAAVAMRSGANNNPLMQKLLAQNGLTPEVASTLDTQGLIARLEEKDPTLAMIAQQLMQPKENQDAAESKIVDVAEYDDIDVDDERARAEELGRAFHRLRQKVDVMYSELEQLRERNDSLAAALGACYLCWGTDPLCEVCGGAGRTGAFEPDREMFVELVIPAVRRLRRNSSGVNKKKVPDRNLDSVSSQDIEAERGEKL